MPLADLAPDYRHPETGETLAQIADRVTAAADQPLLRREMTSSCLPFHDTQPGRFVNPPALSHNHD